MVQVNPYDRRGRVRGTVQPQVRVCRNCQYWGSPKDPDNVDAACSGPSQPHNSKECVHPKIGGGYSAKEKEVPDAINSYEMIVTGPEFGCVHHKFVPAEMVVKFSHR